MPMMPSLQTSAQLLLNLPPELTDLVVGYSQLQRLVRQNVSEFSSLGLGPPALGSESTRGQSANSTLPPDDNPYSAASLADGSPESTVRHEITSRATLIEHGLSLRHPSDADIPCDPQLPYHVELHIPERSRRSAVQAPRDSSPSEDQLDNAENLIPPSDLVIPLPTDASFFLLLTPDTSSLFERLDHLTTNFNSILAKVAESISQAAIPSSSSSRHSFSPYSVTAGNVATLRLKAGGKSDLPTWREIFRIYGESGIFERTSRGDGTIEDAETRLKLFVDLAHKKKTSLLLAGSREAFKAFLKLNYFILEVRKLELANSGSIRKILQEHTKEAILPIPTYFLAPKGASSTDSFLDPAVFHPLSEPLSKLFIHALGEILLPVVPQLEDYSCLICTAIAFKPIRLRCRHFFCVRCLVKLQKHGRADCPMCRAPTVLQANAANVDYALLNFMVDWFPNDVREKQRANDREVTREMMEEYRDAKKRRRRGDGCWIM